ncbi:MAG: LuxR C-terminal-related transcriptional regulator [Alphaproteobacteria bacterium]
MLGLGRSNHLSLGIEDDEPRAGSPLVNRPDIALHLLSLRFLDPGYAISSSGFQSGKCAPVPVCRGLCESGLSNRMIGERLRISPRTVEIHRANMLNKMGASHTSEAIRIAIEASLVA